MRARPGCASVPPGSLFPGNTVSQGFITLAQIEPLNLNNPFGSLKAIAFDFRNASPRVGTNLSMLGHPSCPNNAAA